MRCQLFHVQYLLSRPFGYGKVRRMSSGCPEAQANDSLAYINIVLENPGIREQNQSPVAEELLFEESEPWRIDVGAYMPAS